MARGAGGCIGLGWRPESQPLTAISRVEGTNPMEEDKRAACELFAALSARKWRVGLWPRPRASAVGPRLSTVVSEVEKKKYACNSCILWC